MLCKSKNFVNTTERIVCMEIYLSKNVENTPFSPPPHPKMGPDFYIQQFFKILLGLSRQY